MSATKEEAIEALQKFVNGYEKNICGEAVRQNGFVQAIKVVISALRPVSREQVEKVWRGEWINLPYTELFKNKCSQCGKGSDLESDFCPACGAPMTDEAVEITMKRLEELRND